MGSFILMRYTGCMGWLRNLIFGEPNDEYLARISSIKSIGDGSRAGGMGLPQEGNGGIESKPDETPVASEQKPDQYHLAGGQKIIPEIEVERIKAQPSSDNKSLEIWAYIHNLASFDIELDKCTEARCLRMIQSVRCIFSIKLSVPAIIFRPITRLITNMNRTARVINGICQIVLN